MSKRLRRDQTQLCFYETPAPDYYAAPCPKKLRCGSLCYWPVLTWGGCLLTVETRCQCWQNKSSFQPAALSREVRHRKVSGRAGAPSPALLSATLCPVFYKGADILCSCPDSFTIGKATVRGALLFGSNIMAS